MMVNRKHGITPMLGWEPQAGLHKTWEAVPLYEAGPWTAEECERVTKTLPKKDKPHGPVSEHLMRHWYGAKR